MGQYVIGIDFGTLSGRASLVNCSDGCVLASAVYDYPHGVMDSTLPDGTPLAPDWALQYPQDYLDVLDHTLPRILRESGVSTQEVVGIALDVTASTAMPVRKDGTPLCFLEAYSGTPHAYVKLWKHHGAQRYADEMTRVAVQRNEPWLSAYGGKVSGEWSFPKLWQVLDEAPEIYDAMDGWVEAADWIVWQLCGRWVQNSCALTELAERQKPGESGLLALDWWNGNRSILADFDLTGLMLGMTLRTKPEEIYRALIEATAYGMRVVVENYRQNGIAVDEINALGGISQKNALAMQIYADVLNMPVHVIDCEQGGALGSAIFAAAAAGVYPTVEEAICAMAAPVLRTYTPVTENAAVYEELFAEYKRLHDYFGRGENDVMKHLKCIRHAAIKPKGTEENV